MLKIKSSPAEENKSTKSGVVDSTTEIEELRKKLYTDPVLGCRNRAAFEEMSKDYSGVGTYFSIDINNLKFVNDNFSHEKGDELLKIVADIGVSIWGDNFFKIGGDEDGVYYPEVIPVEQCESWMKHFKDLIEKADEEHPDFPVAAAIGYSFSNSGVDLKTIINEADLMMYENKRAYKESHPEYDMRRARVTVDTVKQAIEDGTFHEYVEQMRAEKGEEPKPKPVLEEIDETVDAVADDDLPAPVKKAPISSIPEVYEDLSAGNEEEAYRQEEFANKINPILHETTKKAVAEAVKAQNDKTKLEISEVLQDEVSSRLSKYERRRRRRDLKEKIGFCIKGVVFILAFLIIFGNAQIRLRISLVAKDAGEIISDLLQGKDTSSNKLVEDLFRDLGDDTNKVNTIDTTKDKGFNIEEGAESNE